jgi:hypothetical protein
VAGKRPTAEDSREAVRRVLAGLARGDDALGLAASLAGLHPAGDTFPGEVLAQLAAEALDCADASRENPIRYEGLLGQYLPECELLCNSISTERWPPSLPRPQQVPER